MDNANPLRTGLRVLVVDNNIDSCELLACLFTQYGVETITATCVSEALEKIQHCPPPDLLISEIMLPNEDGYSLMQRIQTLETLESAQIPAIALTVCAEEKDRLQALAAGFSKCFLKPVNLDELIATVAYLTQQYQVQSISI